MFHYIYIISLSLNSMYYLKLTTQGGQTTLPPSTHGPSKDRKDTEKGTKSFETEKRTEHDDQGEGAYRRIHEQRKETVKMTGRIMWCVKKQASSKLNEDRATQMQAKADETTDTERHK
ncbi:hypothetical protein PAMP_008622 [Pampus punctatissimus]